MLLLGRPDKPISVQNRKLIHRTFPVMSRRASVCRDVTQPKPDQLGRCVIRREVALGLDDLA